MPLEMQLDGDTGIVFTRRFAAPPKAVFDAHLDRDMLRRWLVGYPGWTMPVCEIDPTPGGDFRYRWEPDPGTEGEAFEITGTFHEIEPSHRILHVERMHLAETTPDNTIETLFEPDVDGTLMTMQMSLPTEEMRGQMLATGMADGMEATYALLDGMLTGTAG